jgi:chromosome condensin MukBEF MukE localization factor
LLRLIASRSATDNIDAREAGLEKNRDSLAESFRRLDRNGLIQNCGKGVRGRYRTTLWRITDAGRAYLAKEEGK